MAVLHVARLTDRSGRYYLADLADELGAPALLTWPGPDRSPAGHWVGAGAAGLGLSGAVAEGELAAVLSGHHPRAGHPLRRHPGTVAGYDLVFAAPKSVSVLFGLGEVDQAAAALEGHRDAVVEAVDYVARHAAAVRSGSGDDRRTEPVHGVIAACFEHGVSRALDPHLHTHVVVANMAQGPDGRWRALDGRGLGAHARAAGALYDAHLRHAVSERAPAAWVWRAGGRYELAGMDPVVVAIFSGRQAEIRQHLHAQTVRGAPSSRARAVAWAATREAKAPARQRTAATLRRRWHARAADLGWSRAVLSKEPTRVVEPARPARRAVVDEHRFAAALHSGTLHAGCARRDVVAAWAGAVAPGAPAQDVERCVEALGPWAEAVGVGEPVRARSAVLATPEALRALGPRPATPGTLEVWLTAAAAVDRGRDRTSGAAAPPLGETGRSRCEDLARLPVAELATRLRLERTVADARRRLGVDRTPARRETDRSLGRG